LEQKKEEVVVPPVEEKVAEVKSESPKVDQVEKEEIVPEASEIKQPEEKKVEPKPEVKQVEPEVKQVEPEVKQVERKEEEKELEAEAVLDKPVEEMAEPVETQPADSSQK